MSLPVFREELQERFEVLWLFSEHTVYSFQYQGVFAALLLVFLSDMSLFAACVVLLGFSLFLLFFVIFYYFS